MSVFELRCPSLDYVYDMTWAEFLIRLHAFDRTELRDWYKVREIAWNSLLAPSRDPKKLPSSINKFMKLDDTEVKTNFSKLREAQKKYKEQYG